MNTQNRPRSKGILILDYGSQYTLLIARKLREIGVYCEVLVGNSSTPKPKDFEVFGVVLSGGPDSVRDTTARTLPEWVLGDSTPILGICYGMQLLVEACGGKVRSGEAREYGRAQLRLESDLPQSASAIFYGANSTSVVWMSHGDDVDALPSGFDAVGRTEENVVAAIVHRKKPWIGLQFHPEVQHTENGLLFLRQFVTEICRAPLNWRQDDLVQSTLESIRSHVEPNSRVLMGVSGGVDSTVALAMISRALGAANVVAVFIDNGLLRENESNWVRENISAVAPGVEFHSLDCSNVFLNALKGVVDPEQKRKIIGATFVKEFEAFARSQKGLTHLGQGTLYPDVIESAAHGAGSKVIKSHHNVGGLLDLTNLKLLEPFRFLFKDEVRQLGLEIGVSRHLIERHPFPGPGLGVRVLGEVTSERLTIVRAADHIFMQLLRDHKHYSKVWQAFAVLLPVKTVGVMGDNRTYDEVIALRSVISSDGMTAGVGDLPISFLTTVADRIVRNVSGVNRVVYDITTKPPATIEWE